MKRNGRSRSGVEAKRRRARIARRFRFLRWKLEREVMAKAASVARRWISAEQFAAQNFKGLPKPGDTWTVKGANGETFHMKMIDEDNATVSVVMPVVLHHIDVEIGFTNPDPVPPAQLALYEHMAYLSGEHWCAGWMDRLGETLQGIIDRDNHHPAGYVAFTVEEFEKLKRLRAEAGGWWVWDDAVVDGPEGDCVRFVPDVAK